MRKQSNFSFWLKTIVKTIFVLLLYIAMFSYAMFQGGFVSWFLFYSITLIIVLVLLYVMIPLGSFQVKREIGETAVIANSPLKVTVTITRKWPFPFLYLFVEDDVEESLKQQISIGHYKTIFYPSFKRTLTYTYEIPTIKRGEYHFYHLRLETSDMFGLFHKRKRVKREETLLVYPNYYNIEKWSPYEKRESETRLTTFDFIEEFTSISGAREYVPGDKLTSIDWKVTARMSKLMTKEFEQYLGQNFLVVLNGRLQDDSNRSLQSFEAAVELVTSIIIHANKKQLNVGLWTVEEKINKFPVDSGTEHEKRLIRYLAKIEGKGNYRLSAPSIQLETNNLYETTIVFVSTNLSVKILEQIRKSANRRTKLFFCLVAKNATREILNDKRLEEMRHYGVTTYLLTDGNIDRAISTM